VKIRNSNEALSVLGRSVEGFISIMAYIIERLVGWMLSFYDKAIDNDSPPPKSKRQMKAERRRAWKNKQKENGSGNNRDQGV